MTTVPTTPDGPPARAIPLPDSLRPSWAERSEFSTSDTHGDALLDHWRDVGSPSLKVGVGITQEIRIDQHEIRIYPAVVHLAVGTDAVELDPETAQALAGDLQSAAGLVAGLRAEETNR